ncbi:MAG: 2,3-bisphosphoglycerate-independent phosphoglycerate mutase [Candidatus ainarchaeum sp.]|nr:2,3-bisphosphoglycerate-independent phosphoglycerate mutase [Candidatus ainarchaeum sp.]
MAGNSKKAILLIIDGLGDLPTPKTPLQMAKKPNLDRLAKNGMTGLLAPVKRYVVPGSDTSHLQLLGYEPSIFYHGRGPLEALGLGMDMRNGDVAFRTNFATVKNGRVIDRRAGRIDTKTAGALSRNLSMKIEDVQVEFKNSVEHRGALVLHGPGLSHNVCETDPHELGPVHECHPLDASREAAKTARIVNRFTEITGGMLSAAPENRKREKPANMLLLRGAGYYEKVPSFTERFGIEAACVAGGALYKGIARYLGMDVVIVPGATGDRNTNLRAKAQASVKALQDYDVVFMHVKACDSAGHDGDVEGKKRMLERIDAEAVPILEKSGAYIIITGDHSTPCCRKAHSGHEVPILVCGKGERTDGVTKFDEISCAEGGLGHIRGKDIVYLILNLIEKAEKYGS